MGETRSALGVICSSYDEFFEAEKKIADYMMEHKAEVVDMTVGELARASGTSDATVSRFCRRCGFKGFHSLKLALAREVLEEEQMDKNVSNDIDRGDLRQSLQNILANKVAELTETVNMMDPANLEHILDKLEHARMVQLAAVGNTIPVALDGAFKFNQLGIPAWRGIYGKHRQPIPLTWDMRMWLWSYPIQEAPSVSRHWRRGQGIMDARSFSLPTMEIHLWPGYAITRLSLPPGKSC